MRFIFLFMELFVTMRTKDGRAYREKKRKKKKAVDKFAFSFDLHNNFTKIHIKSGTRHNFGCSHREKEKLLPNHWFLFHQLNKLSLFLPLRPSSASVHKFGRRCYSFFLIWPSSKIQLYFFVVVKFKIEKECIFTGSVNVCALASNKINTLLSDGNDNNVILIYSNLISLNEVEPECLSLWLCVCDLGFFSVCVCFFKSWNNFIAVIFRNANQTIFLLCLQHNIANENELFIWAF